MITSERVQPVNLSLEQEISIDSAELDDKYDGVDASSVADSDKAEYELYVELNEELEAEKAQYGRAVGYFGMVSGMIDNVPNNVVKQSNTVTEIRLRLVKSSTARNMVK